MVDQKTILSQKCTDKKVIEDMYCGTVPRGIKGADDVYTTPWWVKREWLRMAHGIYPAPTEVLTLVNQQFPWASAHVSPSDNAQVAYTPDKASGEQDRQLRTTLGRLLTKLYPAMPDQAIAKMEADHRGELFGTFEELTGQAITDVYTSGGGSAACMSKSEGAFTYKQHPTLAYHAPGISMAVLRDTAGNVSARAMLYRASETDKRYIRIYGDQSLKKRLERQGFKPGAWHGVVFNKVEVGPGSYALPYLDGNGGMGGTTVSCVALLGDKLTSITAEQHDKLRGIKVSYAVCQTSTSGYVALESVTEDAYMAVCPLTGRSYTRMTEETIKLIKGGQTLLVPKPSLDGLDVVSVRDTSGYTYMTVDPVFFHQGYNRLDTPTVRDAYGYAKLDAELYPEECNEWVRHHSRTTDGKIIKSVDIAYIYSDTAASTVRHKSAIKKGFVKLHSMTKGELRYAESEKYVVRTVSGRKVIPAVHDVQRLWDGTYEFQRNASSYYLFNAHIWYSRKNRPSFVEGSEAWMYAFDSTMRKMFTIHGLQGACQFVSNEVAYSVMYKDRSTYVREVPFEHVYQALVGAHPSMMKLVRSRYIALEAEMNAVDYNLPENAQGGAFGTFVPPPDAPDEFGCMEAARRVFYRTELEYIVSNARAKTVSFFNAESLATEYARLLAAKATDLDEDQKQALQRKFYAAIFREIKDCVFRSSVTAPWIISTSPVYTTTSTMYYTSATT